MLLPVDKWPSGAMLTWHIGNRVIHVERFHLQKNYGFLIGVFAEIHKEMGNQKSRLLLVSDGKGHKSVQDYVRELGLSESVIFSDKSFETKGLY